MKRHAVQRSAGIGVGAASIVMVFSVLCLTIFAVLSLVTARSALALSLRTAEAVTDYYAADSLAVEICDALSVADAPPASVSGIAIERPAADSYRYEVPVDGAQTLCVLLRREGGALHILEWTVRSTGDWNPSERINVWDGTVPSEP